MSDPYAKVPPPLPTDGPQERVDWTELEEEGHPGPSGGGAHRRVEGEIDAEDLEPAVDLVEEAIAEVGADTVEGVRTLAGSED
jgi:hypothetical protein